MKIALSGYGKMGRMVEQAARSQAIDVVCVIDPVVGSRGHLKDADVCIDFSEPSAVISNIQAISAEGVSLVVGTTGWYDRIDEVRTLIEKAGTGFVYGSNFSLGVNLMFRIVEHAAGLFKPFSSYDPFIEEAHHKFKKDAPSGTAIFIRNIMKGQYQREVPAASTRAGYFPGTHTAGFDSAADTITITHTARDRSGFAEGAILAAKWIATRKGFFEFAEIIDEQLTAATR